MVALAWFPVAFLLHSRFVFFTPHRHFRAFLKFVSAQWMFFLLGPLTLMMLVELVGFSPIVAYGVSMAFFSLMSFFLSRLVVFRSPTPSLSSNGENSSSRGKP
jgi:putative flippase GtrA